MVPRIMGFFKILFATVLDTQAWPILLTIMTPSINNPRTVTAATTALTAVAGCTLFATGYRYGQTQSQSNKNNSVADANKANKEKKKDDTGNNNRWWLDFFGEAFRTIKENKDASTAEEESFLGGQWSNKRQMHVPRVPYPAWDYDWDGRMTTETSLEALSTRRGLRKSCENGVTRHVILVRHGQYDETSDDDKLRKLTPLGRRQAELTGKRLALLASGGSGSGSGSNIPEMFRGPCKITKLYMSDMTRAKETAKIIAKHLPGSVEVSDPDPLLNEAIPSPIIPVRPDIRGAEQEIDENHDRIERAFRKYVYRADSCHRSKDGNNNEQQQQHHDHEFEVIVGHGNVIRYLFCRTLQLPPEAWLRMSIFNCSLTYLMIKPNGYATARMLGDIGHLGYDETSFSGSHGFNWS